MRVEADGDKPVFLTLRAGTGEIFGARARDCGEEKAAALLLRRQLSSAAGVRANARRARRAPPSRVAAQRRTRCEWRAAGDAGCTHHRSVTALHAQRSALMRCVLPPRLRRTRAGCEVAVNQRVALSNQKVALFTWHGATVELEGSPDIACVPCAGTLRRVLLRCCASQRQAR